MEWLSGFIGFRVRTLVVSFAVVYLLLRRAKFSPVEKQGIWLAGLVFFVARLPLELAAYMQGFWSYKVTTFAILGLPIDVMAAMAVIFGSGAALTQHYFLPRGKVAVILGQLGLALLAMVYDFGGSALYGYLSMQSGGYLVKVLAFFALTLLSGEFFAWFGRRFAKEFQADKEV